MENREIIAGLFLVLFIFLWIVWRFFVGPAVKKKFKRLCLVHSSLNGFHAVVSREDYESTLEYIASINGVRPIRIPKTLVFAEKDLQNSKYATGNIAQMQQYIGKRLDLIEHVDSNSLFIPYVNEGVYSLAEQEKFHTRFDSFEEAYMDLHGLKPGEKGNLFRRIFDSLVQNEKVYDSYVKRTSNFLLLTAIGSGLLLAFFLFPEITPNPIISTVTTERDGKTIAETIVTPAMEKPLFTDLPGRVHDSLITGVIIEEPVKMGGGLVTIRFRSNEKQEMIRDARATESLNLKVNDTVIVRYALVRDSFEGPDFLMSWVITQSEAEALVSTGRFSLY